MALALRPFPAGLAVLVSSWASTAAEVLMWCGLTAAPVPAGQIEAWADEDGVRPFGLYRGEQLVGYGELWVDDDEAEVELARLIVDPRANPTYPLNQTTSVEQCGGCRRASSRLPRNTVRCTACARSTLSHVRTTSKPCSNNSTMRLRYATSRQRC